MLEAYVETVGGNAFGVVYQEVAVYASNFGANAKEVLQSLRQMFPSDELRETNEPSEFAQRAVSALKGIHEGKGANWAVPLALERFPVYTQRVLRAVARIPVGYVASYGGVSEAVGGGARAVGNAMASNCFAPLVPCHRVVTSGLGLGGYGGAGNSGGLRVKFEFLRREKRGYKEPRDVSTEGGVMRVFPVEFVLNKFDKNAFRNSF